MPFNDGFSYKEQLGASATGQTVVQYLSGRHRHSTRDEWTERTTRGEVLLDGAPAQGGERLRAGQVLVWNRPPWFEEDVPREYTVVYRDDDVLAVDKPSGLPTMHGGGFLRNTLLSVVRDSYPRAVALHRLGRATSGLVLFALNARAASMLAEDWRRHAIEKRYRALARGVATEESYDIRARIGRVAHPRLGSVYAAASHGKEARSDARVLERRSDATLFEVNIQTGRPHQIRIHLAFIGHPLVGDELYTHGGVPSAEHPALPGDAGYFLHAQTLTFKHPASGRRVTLSAPPPPPLQGERP
ncbi:RluA family pseudouridine synthase [Deinococcus yavapaiensis]|uniref:Pseudouridine synthase n=1 Tax=Deinococcus yavapaiensis KR-236 TaxID=694435 RepID=A0A318SKI2_9DEIO|nr:RluA family pseudouridine synthase [Deinococcus yavapaiensis]PYE53085.1 RluA family pseudouridine synthase [Deinococcus yavapaiensis KR-236]